MQKTAVTRCEHCGLFVSVTGSEEAWNTPDGLIATLDFRFGWHNLMHLAKGSDVFSQMGKTNKERRLLMPDIREASKWNEHVSEFKDFAHRLSAEFNFRILENGKECVEVRQFYRPQKGEENVKS